MKDRFGRIIPERLEGVFSGTELDYLLEQYKQLGDHIRSRMLLKDSLFTGINQPTFEAICSDMQCLLKAQGPFAVCDWCNGAGCEHCNSKGWTGKFVWDMTPRKE
jgi:hypothetical protein